MNVFRICAGALIAGTLLVACGGNRGFSPPISAGAGVRAPLSSSSGTETVLYKFEGGTDGENPDIAAPAYANGVLYGTTLYGGSATCAVDGSPAGCGTVFEIDTSGSGYKVLHRFPKSGLDGDSVWAGLSETDGILYGTTQWGGGKGKSSGPCSGDNGCGTVFQLNASGDADYKILNRFTGSDGTNIRPGVVVDASGTLYGATGGNAGSSSKCPSYSNTGCGLVYKLADGKETVLHTFAGSPDGYGPFFGPIVVNGTIYGTTLDGGDNSPDCITSGSGCGVIYAMSTSGKGYRILHRFKAYKDGYAPWAGVTYTNGKLYGVALYGGNTGCYDNNGCGTIFELDTSGKAFKTLYRFTGKSDGGTPNPLAISGHTIYVSGEYGGVNDSYCGSQGCGTVIELDTSGKDVKVLYQFRGGSDGWYPNAVFEQNGTIYGTTFLGGGSGCGGSGCGTVFGITP